MVGKKGKKERTPLGRAFNEGKGGGTYDKRGDHRLPLDEGVQKGKGNTNGRFMM